MYCQFHSHAGRVSEAQIFFYTIYDYHNLSMIFQFKICNSVLFVSVTVEYIASCTDKFIGEAMIFGGCLFRGELLFLAKADGIASST